MLLYSRMTIISVDKISQWRVLVPCVSGVETSGYATRQKIGKVDIRKIGCVDGKWMEMAQDRIQCWALILVVLNFCVLLTESQLIGKMDLTERDCEDWRWMEMAQDRVQ